MNEPETLLTASKFRVVRETVTTAGGKTKTREIVRHPGACVIVPLLDDGRVCLIRNWRNPFEDSKGISIENGEGRISHSLLVDNAIGVSGKGGNGVTVRVRIDNEPGKPQLRAGMSVLLSVETGHPRGVPESIARWFRWSGR